MPEDDATRATPDAQALRPAARRRPTPVPPAEPEAGVPVRPPGRPRPTLAAQLAELAEGIEAEAEVEAEAAAEAEAEAEAGVEEAAAALEVELTPEPEPTPVPTAEPAPEPRSAPTPEAADRPPTPEAAQRPSGPTPTPAPSPTPAQAQNPEPTPVQAPVKKAAAKKAPVKQPPTKKTPNAAAPAAVPAAAPTAAQAPAKKAPAKGAPAKKAAAAEAPVTETSAAKSPAKTAPAKAKAMAKVPAKAPAKAPVKAPAKAPANKAPAKAPAASPSVAPPLAEPTPTPSSVEPAAVTDVPRSSGSWVTWLLALSLLLFATAVGLGAAALVEAGPRTWRSSAVVELQSGPAPTVRVADALEAAQEQYLATVPQLTETAAGAAAVPSEDVRAPLAAVPTGTARIVVTAYAADADAARRLARAGVDTIASYVPIDQEALVGSEGDRLGASAVGPPTEAVRTEPQARRAVAVGVLAGSAVLLLALTGLALRRSRT